MIAESVDQMEAALDNVEPLLRDIGRGSCGSVFELPGTLEAIKKGANTTAIWNDFNLTNLAYNSYLSQLGTLRKEFPGRRVPCVPAARWYNGPEADAFWNVNLARFPEGDRTRAATFHLDRIMPVSSSTRQALVQKFFLDDQETRLRVLRDPSNKDCLVRVYFGQNNPSSQPYDHTDTLRNFPLYLGQAKTIGLEIEVYAEEMAIGLAVLHWEAGIDAQDTEFVIGKSTRTTFSTVHPNHKSNEIPISTTRHFTNRETQLWMLDYDKCSLIELDSDISPLDIVKKYLVAVTGNDPYFPHPRLDIALWQTFRDVYLKASQTIIRTNRLNHRQLVQLPEMLIEQWEAWGDQDMEKDEFDPFERNPGDQETEIESSSEDEEYEEIDDDDDDNDDDNSGHHGDNSA